MKLKTTVITILITLLSLSFLQTQAQTTITQSDDEEETDITEQIVNTECNQVLQQFEDVSNENPFCVFIEFLLYQEVISNNKNFNPEKDLNRGQLAKIIVEGLKIPSNTEGETFPDVNQDHTFYNYIQTLKNSNIISGYSDGNYKPDENVTRGALMKFIVNAARTTKNNTFEEPIAPEGYIFEDLAPDHSFAPFINVAYQTQTDEGVSIISGYSDGTFKPDKKITRGEVSKVIANTIKLANSTQYDCFDYYCQEAWTKILQENLESKLLNLINTSRKKVYFPELSENKDIAIVAKRWSSLMNQLGYLSHNSNLYGDLINEGFTNLEASGENIAYTELDEKSEENDFIKAITQEHNKMMQETPPNDEHKRNILGDYDQIGIGVIVEKDSQTKEIEVWITQNYVRV